MTGGRVLFNDRDIFAIIDHAPGTVDFDTVCDPDADCNRPAIDPNNWLDHIYCHSELDYFRLAVPRQLVSVTHAALAGKTTTVGAWPKIQVVGDRRATDILLVAHGLGIVPRYMISYLGARLPAGRRIQFGDNLGRVVQHYATATGIYLREYAYSSDQDLPAMSADYDVRVFDVPAADPNLPLRSYDAANGVYQVCHGKLRSDREYLRRAHAAESGFDFNLGPTQDYANGGVRTVTGGNVIDDNGYSGAFAGPAFVAVT